MENTRRLGVWAAVLICRAYLPVNCFPMVPSASKALGLSPPRSALAGVVVAGAVPVEGLEPVLELPWDDIVDVVVICRD